MPWPCLSPQAPLGYSPSPTAHCIPFPYTLAFFLFLELSKFPFNSVFAVLPGIFSPKVNARLVSSQSSLSLNVTYSGPPYLKLPHLSTCDTLSRNILLAINTIGNYLIYLFY